MKKIVWVLVAALQIGASAHAAEKGPQKGKETPTPAVDPAARDAVASARYMFRRRVDLCAPPQKCGADVQSIIDAAEERFVKACRACATAAKCEEDRAAVRSGKSSSSYNPCD